ncbi:MAG: hypothetical protein HDT14_01820 [Oscillibacter sp.]|nr:hypothetical protein [Oscillibacter sp.]
MQDLLKNIFDGIYEPQIVPHPMTKEESAAWERAIAILGEKMVDEMVSAQCHSLAETEYEYFRQGFRLGAQLMLELR